MTSNIHSLRPIQPRASLGRTMAEWEASLPRAWATCYVCGDTYETYAALRTSPPPWEIIQSIEQIKPVGTCFSPDCMRREQMRQDALYSHLLQPLLDKCEGSRARAMAKEQAKNKGR